MSVRPIILFIFILLVSQSNVAQTAKPFAVRDHLALSTALEKKIGSGRFLMKLAEKKHLRDAGNVTQRIATAKVVVYMHRYPSRAELDALEARGLACFLNTWTPPMENHPLGFFLASLPIEKLNDVLALDFVKKLDTAEGMNVPLNNNAAKSIHANAAWAKGWTGKGVKIGVLDSGIHADSSDSDLPVSYEKKDYSNFPQLDNDVVNRITGHGTHVTGSILGRGVLSAANTGNGGDAYKGMAPEASLAFFKIGGDSTGFAEDAAIIAAMHDAVTLYQVKILNMSYGGWSAYHDGSDPLEQKVDWCFTQGVAVFLSAGNEANGARHVMGTVQPNSESDFIQVNIRSADATQTRPSFNLAWFDGVGIHNNLNLRYFDASKNEITNINRAPTTESPRGTESQYSSMQSFAPDGSSTYFLKVVNPSSSVQVYHVYEDYTEWSRSTGSIMFENPNAEYTIGSPSSADHAFSIAAFVTRPNWISAQYGMRRFYQTLDNIASFSSRGPRVDGAMKPNIAAPGSAVISLRDRNLYRNPDGSWVDNDGIAGGDGNYYVMQGTSMASPVCAGAAALLLSKYPTLTPQQVYDSLDSHARKDVFTGATPNTTWGAGKLDLSFLSGIINPTDGWTQTNPTGWDGQGIPAIAVNAQGNVFVTVGKPWVGDTSRIYRSTDNGSTWIPIKAEQALAPLVVTKKGHLITAGRNQGMIHRSIDNGNSWTTFGAPRDYTSIALTPDDSLIAGTYGQGVYYSMNDGVTWITLNAGLPANAQVPFVAGGSNHLYAGAMTSGIVRLYRLVRSSSNWALSDNGIDTTKHVNACAVMPDGTVFAAVVDRIYRSMDFGVTWQQVTILNDYLQSLHAFSNNVIFVGTIGGGVYRSSDKGITWSGFSDGLTTLNIAPMASNANGMIYAGADRERLFKRTVGALPAKVILQEPANNAPATTPIWLKWLSVPSAVSYWLQVSATQDFSNPLISVQQMNQLEWQASFVQMNQQYFWRVCAMGNAGAGPWSDVWSFTASPTPPQAPRLFMPVNQSTNIQDDVTLSWNASDGATSYHAQVSTTSTFASTVIDQSGLQTLSHQTANLGNGITYYWRVRASNSAGAGGWSDIWSFTTIIRIPVAPLLLSPVNDAIGVSTNPTLVWNASPGSTSYRLQVSAEPIFQTTVFDQSNLSSTSQQVAGLLGSTKYYWRVNATNSVGTSAWSSEWSFTTSAGLPAAPTLLTPNDQSVNIPVNPNLTWNASSGADSYSLHVGVDANFMPPLVFSQSGITGTSQLVTGLPNKATLYWRVNAANSAGTSAWSNAWSFTTILAPPAAPTLFSPVNNATNVSLNPTMSWGSAPTADSYRMQVALNSGFSPALFDQSSLTGTSQALSNLSPSVVHYWRVNATNAGGTSMWSIVWSFTTSSGTDVRDRLISPESIELYQNFPNPFSERTAISYKLSARSFVKLEVFDLFGRKVATLVDEEKEAGEHTAVFDIPQVRSFGQRSTFDISSDVYFYRLTTPIQMEMKKMIVITP